MAGRRIGGGDENVPAKKTIAVDTLRLMNCITADVLALSEEFVRPIIEAFDQIELDPTRISVAGRNRVQTLISWKRKKPAIAREKNDMMTHPIQIIRFGLLTPANNMVNNTPPKSPRQRIRFHRPNVSGKRPIREIPINGDRVANR